MVDQRDEQLDRGLSDLIGVLVDAGVEAAVISHRQTDIILAAFKDVEAGVVETPVVLSFISDGNRSAGGTVGRVVQLSPYEPRRIGFVMRDDLFAVPTTWQCAKQPCRQAYQKPGKHVLQNV